MFTDIEGSTALGRRLGDHRMRQLLDRHDETAAEAAGHRGRIINTMGDGVVAVFDGRQRGCVARLTLSRRCVPTSNSPSEPASVWARSRHAEVTFGPGVNPAARITDVAMGGEVLVSRTIVDLVAGAGLDFEDRGAHSLKGLSGEHHLFSARR